MIFHARNSPFQPGFPKWSHHGNMILMGSPRFQLVIYKKGIVAFLCFANMSGKDELMANIDKKGRLKENPFSYRLTKSNKVIIFWRKKQIMIIKGNDSKRFLSKIVNKSDHQIQLILAKITGNFKHGNET
jgi:hypothetical protein